ncbi:MAG: NTP/NDP exchange transporter [Candidatus Binatia bacterium]
MVHKTLAFFKISPGEGFRVAVIAGLLFLLIAANNLVKILRDSVFLGHHSVSELPYLYILVAFLAGAIIATYTKYTANLSIIRLILVTNAVILSNIIFFWFLLTYYNPGWSHYAFYIWSAMVSVIAVAQLWTLANQIFTLQEGKRSFGLLAAGGSVGGAVAGFGVKWLLHPSAVSHHLLWFIGGLYIVASATLLWAQHRVVGKMSERELGISEKPDEAPASSIGELLAGSAYLKTIATLIFVSVIVSTLIDFEFKTAAKQAYPSAGALAVFFSSYYGWLSVATFFAELVLTGKILSTVGLKPSLGFTPATLLIGSLGIMIWPGLLAAALTRMADTTLRESIHRSGMEILYMPLSAKVKKTVKTFLEVVIERTGDATAGFIVLLTLYFAGTYHTYVHFVCIALIFVWMLIIALLRTGQSLNTELKSQGLAPTDEPSGDKYSKQSASLIK